jgi:hypothetical protein
MAATRTQIYLTAVQRAKLGEITRREGKSMAQIVREALDAYLAERRPDPDEALATTFGSMPDLVVPAREAWDCG